MKILVANIGSTSLKYRLFRFDGDVAHLLAKGTLERIADYPAAIAQCLADLKAGGHLADERELAAVGFKPVIARGTTGCVEMDDDVLEAMEAWSGIAPAHNPPYVDGIRMFRARMPRTPMVGLFETAFYQWVPEAASRYAVPEQWHRAGIRRWGFHGASHKFLAERTAELLGRHDVAERVRNLYVDHGATPVDGPALRIVTCHLGGSSSITAARDGIAIGNSFGMSPQSGLPHNNRAGDLDAAAIPYLMRDGGLTLDEVERVLAKESGLKGIGGGSNDVRDIEGAAEMGDARAQLALDVLVHEIRRWIGGFVLELGGLDALVFSGGIGENSASLRAAVCRDLDFIGVRIADPQPRLGGAEDASIGAAGSPAKVFAIRTNEELVIAREVRRWLERQGGRRKDEG